MRLIDEAPTVLLAAIGRLLAKAPIRVLRADRVRLEELCSRMHEALVCGWSLRYTVVTVRHAVVDSDFVLRGTRELVDVVGVVLVADARLAVGVCCRDGELQVRESGEGQACEGTAETVAGYSDVVIFVFAQCGVQSVFCVWDGGEPGLEEALMRVTALTDGLIEE